MKGIHSEALRKAMYMAVAILKKSRCKDFDFHNYNHTLEVVTHCIELASNNDLNFYQMEPILIAAWLHDVGYSETYSGHENVSERIAKDLLLELGWAPVKMEKILKLIRVTRLPQQPDSIEEMIICDADLFHLGTNKFLSQNDRLRKELYTVTGKEFTDSDWIEDSLVFMHSHKYFTTYGKVCLSKNKQENIIALENSIRAVC